MPDFDEYPGVSELRRRVEREASRLRRWEDGFEALVAARACEPVATMRELLTFWLGIAVLEEACDADAGGTRLCVEMSPTSPWMAVYLHYQEVDRQILNRALQFLARFRVPWDPGTTRVAPADPHDASHEPADAPAPQPACAALAPASRRGAHSSSRRGVAGQGANIPGMYPFAGL
jgi:hypothetical protein